MREIFDRVKAHLLAQGARAGYESASGVFICRYLDGDGRKCAVGCLIDDDQYDPSLEGIDSNSTDVLSAVGLDQSYGPLLFSLQFLHDDEEPEDWAQALDRLEEEYF